MGIRQEYHKNTLGMAWEYSRNGMGRAWENLRNSIGIIRANTIGILSELWRDEYCSNSI